MTAGHIAIIAALVGAWTLLTFGELAVTDWLRRPAPAPEPRLWPERLPRPGEVIEGMGCSPAPPMSRLPSPALALPAASLSDLGPWPDPPPPAIDVTATTAEAPLPALTTGGGR